MNVEIARVYLLSRDDRDDPVEVAFAYEGGALAGFDERETEKTITGLNRSAVGFGFGHAGEMLRAFNAGIEADAVAWLLHPRRAGRSFALPGRHDWPGGVGLAVCYPELSERPEPMHGPVSVDPATVAHELLHLFGASDKYHQPLAAFRKGTVSRHEVMRLGDERLSRLRVDRRTAVEIGWVSG